jgi:hypothetical protein
MTIEHLPFIVFILPQNVIDLLAMVYLCFLRQEIDDLSLPEIEIFRRSSR